MIKRNNKYGFTLVELLAVIVILAIILVIAVPKVMSVIEDSKKATLESTAKMIASAAEKAKVQNTVLGKTEEITCESVAKINDLDYDTCSIEFVDNTAKVTIKGKGKFAGLHVCGGNKTEAVASGEECSSKEGNIGTDYIAGLLAKEETLKNGLMQTNAEYNGTTYDAGIRYTGELDEVKNKVYYNCDDTDSSGVAYGEDGYNYASSCEVWRIIGVFDTKTTEEGLAHKRIKLVNTESTFQASWDSSEGEYISSSEYSGTNSGYGINQWGPSDSYEGADLMQLLNGYYISKSGATCAYCNTSGQGVCEQICTSDSLKNNNMKVLTTIAKNMIENAVWDTYAAYAQDYALSLDNAMNIYLSERGVSRQYVGNEHCSNDMQPYYCNDTVDRKEVWTGFVGLPYASDMTYADGWLYSNEFSITPTAHSYGSGAFAFYGSSSEQGIYFTKVSTSKMIFPSVYLKSDVKIIGGNGDTEPYKLAI